jgi:hypothetical protein
LLNQQPTYERILHSEVSLQLGDEMSVGHVTKRAIGPDGTIAGTYDENPYLNSMIYEVEFPDEQVQEYAANTIAENMLTQVDEDGFSPTMMSAIIDYRKDVDATISKADKHVVTHSGNNRPRKTTIGWSLLVQWADKYESWIPLKDLKESHPCETADFAKTRGIADEPAFEWWVPYTLRKRTQENNPECRYRFPKKPCKRTRVHLTEEHAEWYSYLREQFDKKRIVEFPG